MIKSFQMKLALLATTVSAGVLIVFALVFWQMVADSHQQRLDRDLVGLAYQLLNSGEHTVEDLHVNTGQMTIFGEELSGAATMVTDASRDIEYQSENWPSGLNTALLPEATQLNQTDIPEHVHDGHDTHGSSHDEHGSGDFIHKKANRHGEQALVQPQYKTVNLDDDQWRIVGLGSAGYTLYVALDLAAYNANLSQVHNTLFVIVFMALLISALGAWLIARRALRPVRSLTKMAESITVNKLGQQIDDPGTDLEFSRLIQVFNEMLLRLDDSFRQAVRFSADASHELKTPLTIMHGEMETALQNAETGSESQLSFASQLEEVQRLNNLVSKLLLLSHADSGALKPASERFDFTDLVQKVCEDVGSLDPEISVECHADVAINLVGDEDLLRQVVQNLAVNAVRYNLPGGWIKCKVEKSADSAILLISNSAKPIPESDQEKIFRRFYRVDEARTGESTGLGLSLAREITRVHGGQLTLVSSDNIATVFKLVVPLKLFLV